VDLNGLRSECFGLQLAIKNLNKEIDLSRKDFKLGQGGGNFYKAMKEFSNRASMEISLVETHLAEMDKRVKKFLKHFGEKQDADLMELFQLIHKFSREFEVFAINTFTCIYHFHCSNVAWTS
jgi:hypothetical protein